MCGRYGLTIAQDELALALEIERISFDWAPRFNIAPTQAAPILRVQGGSRELALLRWGLVPFWADDRKIGNRMINARSETVATKPAFRAAFRSRRCLVPLSGFYEWARRPDGKYPFWIHPAEGSVITVAGLWESWSKGDSGDPLLTFTILTTRSNELINPLHDRMPVVISAEDRSRWLDPEAKPEALDGLFEPRPGVEFDLYEVSRLVNSPANDTPECLTAASGPEE